jgi:4-O-beta-D-mannosyl-D-glucose phosphorylase
MIEAFEYRKKMIIEEHIALLTKANKAILPGNGVYHKFENAVLTADHVPLEWRYDFNEDSNPFFMERIGANSTFNAGAIKWKGKYILIARVEGVDRKSFFALAESENGIDNFRFRKEPISLPQVGDMDVNVYDIRLTVHDDGWIYGVFCTEKRDEKAPLGDQSAAIAQCGIIRTKDLFTWERLPNLITDSPQQRNVVLHPEFVNGMYGFYTRPQDRFIEAGNGGGIAFGLTEDITNAVIHEEKIIHAKKYHTVYEAKNGQGPAPLKTSEGWLHLAHGVRNTAAGLRYVLYIFMTSLNDLTKVIYQPAGYFLAAKGSEIIGDVGNVVFANGWILDENGKVFIYYASSDSRMHVAVSSLNQLLDYVKNTPADGYYSSRSVENIKNLIEKNKSFYG